MTVSDDDRITYLAGDSVDSLSAQECAHPDELRELLRAPATWAEPAPGTRTASSTRSRLRRALGAPAETPTAKPRSHARRCGSGSASVAPRTRSAGSRRLRPRCGRCGDRHVAQQRARPAALRDGCLRHSACARCGRLRVTYKTGLGWRLELWANGLPHLENGRYYQAWLKNAAGILFAVGTFNDARHVTLWSGVRWHSCGP